MKMRADRQDDGHDAKSQTSRRSFWEVLRNAFRPIGEDEYRAFEQTERIAEAEKKGETNG